MCIKVAVCFSLLISGEMRGLTVPGNGFSHHARLVERINLQRWLLYDPCCVCECVSHPVSCPSVGMEALQVTQLPINDLYQSWFPSRLSSFQRQMWRPQPAHSELRYQTGGRLLGVCSICSGWMDRQPVVLWTLDFLHDFSNPKIAASRCETSVSVD